MIKYFSTFSGIGTFEYVINELGLNRECVGYSEIDKHSIKTYNKHYPKHKNYGDIKKIITNDLPNFGILVGGSPCQSFSDAGSKKGFEDYRGNLFFDYIRILKEKQPDYFIFENVRGILTNNKGKTFKIINNEFDKAGYNIKRKILNASEFGSVQNRPRIFIVGQKKSLGNFNFEFPTGTKKKEFLKNILEKNVDEKYYLSNEQIKNRYKSNYHSNKSQLLNNTCCCITASGTKKRIILNEDDITRKKYYDKKLEYNQVIKLTGRTLTEIEYERLQGFHDNYTNSGISKEQRYKQLGNSINVNVLKEILKNLDKYIKKSKIL
ncbi:MAG: DNA (cytosine-5-)-methyltransferase [Candidatus Gracilibacteria bacterium]|nr:DNA (cytosine-5-)-methyltransferase [Candidatus Gracilibacteria bacterium]